MPDGDPSALCQPAGAFTAEALPPAPSSSWYDGSVLNISTATPRVLVSERGDLGHAGIQDYRRSAPGTWTDGSIGGDATWLSPGMLAATTDSPLCVAYEYDDASLHVACEGMPDRAIAPRTDGSIAIAHVGTVAGVVYEGQDAQLSGLLWQPFDGGSFDGNPGPAELIDAQSQVGMTSIAVDSAGDTHVAYEVLANSQRVLFHAVRHAGTWTREQIDQDVPPTFDGQASSTLSLVIDGDQPVVAYGYAKNTRVKLARRAGDGTWSARTLVSTDPGFPHDYVGTSVALQRDCGGQLLIVYQRSISTDAPNIGLAYARITDTGLADQAFLPPLPQGSPSDFFYGDSLAFQIDATGHQVVSGKMITSGSGQLLYFASR